MAAGVKGMVEQAGESSNVLIRARKPITSAEHAGELLMEHRLPDQHWRLQLALCRWSSPPPPDRLVQEHSDEAEAPRWFCKIKLATVSSADARRSGSQTSTGVSKTTVFETPWNETDPCLRRCLYPSLNLSLANPSVPV